MKSQLAIPYYSPRETFLHKVPNGLKFILSIFYVTLTLICYQPLSLEILLFLFISTTFLLRFPVRGWALAICLLIALGYFVMFFSVNDIVTNFVVAISKIFNVSLVFALFSRTTKLNTLLNKLTSTTGSFTFLRPIFYVLNTIMAIYPSIQYEFDKAVSAEGIRRGKPLRYYNFDSYILILSVTLVRILNRSERFTDTVIERGLTPGTVFHLPDERNDSLGEKFLSLALFIPGCLIAWLEFVIL